MNAAFSASGFGNATSLTSLALSSLSNTGASGSPARRTQAHLGGELARDRRRESHAHRPDRQARRVRALALAAELGGEGGAHRVAEALLDRRHDARIARRGDALAPDQPHRRAVRQRPLAARDQRAPGLRLSIPRAFSNCARSSPPTTLSGDPLADSLDLAPCVGDDARLDRRRRSAAAGSAGLPRSRCRRRLRSRRRPGRRWRTRSGSFRSAPERSRRPRRRSRRRPSASAASRCGRSRCSSLRGRAARESRTARRGRWPSGRCRRGRLPGKRWHGVGETRVAERRRRRPKT